MSALAQRPAIRCPECRLNQYVTQNELCRRCHAALFPKPIQVMPPKIQNSPMRVGNIYREVRMLKGLSQKQLSILVRSSRPWISRIERDEIEPTADSLMRIAEGLGVTISTLLPEGRLERMMLDPFLAILAQYAGSLSNEQRLQVIGKVEELHASHTL